MPCPMPCSPPCSLHFSCCRTCLAHAQSHRSPRDCGDRGRTARVDHPLRRPPRRPSGPHGARSSILACLLAQVGSTRGGPAVVPGSADARPLTHQAVSPSGARPRLDRHPVGHCSDQLGEPDQAPDPDDTVRRTVGAEPLMSHERSRHPRRGQGSARRRPHGIAVGSGQARAGSQRSRRCRQQRTTTTAGRRPAAARPAGACRRRSASAPPGRPAPGRRRCAPRVPWAWWRPRRPAPSTVSARSMTSARQSSATPTRHPCGIAPSLDRPRADQQALEVVVRRVVHAGGEQRHLTHRR